VGVLLLILVVTVGWAASTAWRRHARARWTRPLEVGIVLLASEGTVDAEAWRAGVARLSDRLAEEKRRWLGPGPEPFSFTVVGPVPWKGSLPVTPPEGSLGDRLWHALDVWRTIRDVERAAGGGAGGFDVRVFFLAAIRIDAGRVREVSRQVFLQQEDQLLAPVAIARHGQLGHAVVAQRRQVVLATDFLAAHPVGILVVGGRLRERRPLPQQRDAIGADGLERIVVGAAQADDRAIGPLVDERCRCIALECCGPALVAERAQRLVQALRAARGGRSMLDGVAGTATVV
jgi:hypothetical protein